jgi:hypothetical protein
MRTMKQVLFTKNGTGNSTNKFFQELNVLSGGQKASTGRRSESLEELYFT